MDENQLAKNSGWLDFLALTGLAFTAIFWTLDSSMMDSAGEAAIDLPAKRYLLMAFAGIWLVAGGLYSLRVMFQKQVPDKALLLGGFVGMMIGELLAFRKIVEIWFVGAQDALQEFDPNNPMDIGGSLWSERWVQIGIVFAGVGLGLFLISMFPMLLRRKKR